MGHAHDQSTAGAASVTRLGWALGISVVILIVQLWGSVLTGSLALLGDTAHIAVDSSGLVIAFITAMLIKRPASSLHSWGLQRLDVVAAFVQASILIVVGAFLIIGAFTRLVAPSPIQGTLLLVFGLVGLVGNLISLMILVGDTSKSMNVRAAILDMFADSLGSFAVVVAAVIEMVWGWSYADAIAALFICILIIPRAIKLFRETLGILLEATPRELDSQDIIEHFLRKEFVVGVHDLHVTQLSSHLPVLTAHIVIRDEELLSGNSQQALNELQQCAMEHFPLSIEHSTFQLESEDASCALHNAHS